MVVVVVTLGSTAAPQRLSVGDLIDYIGGLVDTRNKNNNTLAHSHSLSLSNLSLLPEPNPSFYFFYF